MKFIFFLFAIISSTAKAGEILNDELIMATIEECRSYNLSLKPTRFVNSSGVVDFGLLETSETPAVIDSGAQRITDLLLQGANPNAILVPEAWDIYSRTLDMTPLMYAASNGCPVEYVKILAPVTDINHLSSYNETALSLALSQYQSIKPEGLEVISYLISLPNIEVNNADSFGFTPLLFALKRDLPFEIIKKLVELKADINAQENLSFTTPVSSAQHAQQVELLVTAGADINQADKNGETPLMKAWPIPEVIKALIDAKANVNAVNNKGESVLSIWKKLLAKRNPSNRSDYEAIIKLLTDAGAI